MSEDSGKRMLHVATDANRRIAAAILDGGDAEISLGLESIAGQTVYEIELPDELARLESPEEIFAVLVDATVTPTGELRYRRFERRDAGRSS